MQEIRDQVVQYLHNQIKLSELNDWLTQRSWNMHLDASLAAQHFAANLELLLVEYSNGHLFRSELEYALLNLVNVLDPVSPGLHPA